MFLTRDVAMDGTNKPAKIKIHHGGDVYVCGENRNEYVPRKTDPVVCASKRAIPCTFFPVSMDLC